MVSSSPPSRLYFFPTSRPLISSALLAGRNNRQPITHQPWSSTVRSVHSEKRQPRHPKPDPPSVRRFATPDRLGSLLPPPSSRPEPHELTPARSSRTMERDRTWNTSPLVQCQLDKLQPKRPPTCTTDPPHLTPTPGPVVPSVFRSAYSVPLPPAPYTTQPRAHLVVRPDRQPRPPPPRQRPRYTGGYQSCPQELEYLFR